MAISASGIISGLDVSSLIQASMVYDRLPLERAQKQLSSTESKISALGQVKSAIASLQEAAKNIADSSKLYSYQGSLGNADIASVTANSGAVSGTYNLEVTQLATNHKLTSATNIDLSQGGTLKIQVGNGAEKDVSIAAGASLTDLAKAINDADAGASATVINGENGAQHLMLTSNETGKANEIKISSTNIASLNNSSMTETQEAKNAIVKIDGITLAATSNTITDAVTGVDLTLKTTGNTQLTVSNDTSELESQLSKFVEAYNKARDTMKDLSKFDSSGNKNHGVLNGDGTVRSAMDELRGLLSAVPEGLGKTALTLVDLGVESNGAGTLSLDTGKLKTAMQTDFAQVTKSIAAYGSAFEARTTAMNGTDGLITSRLDGLNAATSRLNDTISTQETRLATIQARYEKQYSNLEVLISSLTTTGNYLTQQLASLSS